MTDSLQNDQHWKGPHTGVPLLFALKIEQFIVCLCVWSLNRWIPTLKLLRHPKHHFKDPDLISTQWKWLPWSFKCFIWDEDDCKWSCLRLHLPYVKIWSSPAELTGLFYRSLQASPGRAWQRSKVLSLWEYFCIFRE